MMIYFKQRTMKKRVVTSVPSNELLSLAEEKITFDLTGEETMKNVIDSYKGLSQEEIRSRVRETSFPYAVLFENWIGDFNLSTGIRNANAFGAKEIFYIGRKRFDKRGAVGSYHYKDITFLESHDQILKLKDSYKFIGVDNIPGSLSMRDFMWPKNTLMIFGEEGRGLSSLMQELCECTVYIEQFGSVRSVNCGTASGITMVDYTNKACRR